MMSMPPKKKKSTTDWKSNFSAIKYLPRFFKLIYLSSPALFVTNVLSRLVKSITPILMLWVGKLIIDEVILQANSGEGDMSLLWTYLGIELALAVISNLLNRAIDLTDGLHYVLFGISWECLGSLKYRF